MKTDQLIDVLSTNVERVDRSRLSGTLVGAVAIGGVVAFCAMLTTIGLRPGLGNGANLTFLALKLLFTVSLLVLGASFLVRAIRPGQDSRKSFRLAFVPFVAVGAVALAALALVPPSTWNRVILSTTWASSLICIPLFAIIPFGVLIWALRRGAPTNLRRTGAIAGLVAGAVGASAYAFACPANSIPFIAIWYGAAIAFCAVIGAIVGPRLLRW
jgi:hypothetical protein